MPDDWAGRAIAPYEAMQSAFSIPRLRLYRESMPGVERPFAYCWPFVRAMAATNDLAELPDGARYIPDVAARLAGLEHYWDDRAGNYASYVVPPLGDGGDAYYDDNAWAGLELVRAHRLTGDAAALERARAVFQFLAGGWDDNSRHPAPGGVFWVAAGWNGDRNTVSTAPSAQLALRLAALEEDGGRRRDYLAWAGRMSTWVDTTLRGEDGLYADHIDLRGNVDRAAWSYNQGAMIGAHVLLYEATGAEHHLTEARRTAAAARSFYTPDVLDRQELAFNAIYLANLARLATIDGDATLLDGPRAWAERLWTICRDARTSLATTSRPLKLLDQAAFVSIFAILGAEDAGANGGA